MFHLNMYVKHRQHYIIPVDENVDKVIWDQALRFCIYLLLLHILLHFLILAIHLSPKWNPLA